MPNHPPARFAHAGDNPGLFIVSLDYELVWGVRNADPVAKISELLGGARESVERHLRLFETYAIHATWAAAGLLFHDNLDELIATIRRVHPVHRPPLLERALRLAQIAPPTQHDAFIAPDLVRRIAANPAHELASHTYSHYCCLEPDSSLEAFSHDMAQAVALAAKAGTQLRSIVFPGNQVNPAFLPACLDLGLMAYRGNQRSVLCQPRIGAREPRARRMLRIADRYLNLSGHSTHPLSAAGAERPYNLCASRYFRPFRSDWRSLERLKLARIVSGMRYAARRGEVFHLWWHPEYMIPDSAENFAQLERLLAEYTQLRERHGLRSVTMAEAAALL